MSSTLSNLRFNRLVRLYKIVANDSYIRLLVMTVLTWGVLDTLSTFLAITAYGSIDYEANPITAWLLSVHPIMLVIGKGIAMGAIVYLALRGRDSITAVPGWRVYFHVIVWIGVFIVVMNVYAAYTATTGHDPLFT